MSKPRIKIVPIVVLLLLVAVVVAANVRWHRWCRTSIPA